MFAKIARLMILRHAIETAFAAMLMAKRPTTWVIRTVTTPRDYLPNSLFWNPPEYATRIDRYCRRFKIHDTLLATYRLKRIRDENPMLKPVSGIQMRFGPRVANAAAHLRSMQEEIARVEFEMRFVQVDMDTFGTYDDVDWDYDTWVNGVYDGVFDTQMRRANIGTQMAPFEDHVRYAIATALFTYEPDNYPNC